MSERRNIKYFTLTEDEKKIVEFLGLTEEQLEITKDKIDSNDKAMEEAIRTVKTDMMFRSKNQAKLMEIFLSKLPDYGRLKELSKIGNGKQYAHVILWKYEPYVELAYTVLKAKKEEYKKAFPQGWSQAVEITFNLVGAFNYLATFRPDLFIHIIDDCELLKFFKDFILEMNRCLKEYEFERWKVVYQRLKSGYKEGRRYGVI